jgi:hypothetical protein
MKSRVVISLGRPDQPQVLQAPCGFNRMHQGKVEITQFWISIHFHCEHCGGDHALAIIRQDGLTIMEWKK